MKRTKESAALVVAEGEKVIVTSMAKRNPAHVWLASLAPSGRRTMVGRLFL